MVKWSEREADNLSSHGSIKGSHPTHLHIVRPTASPVLHSVHPSLLSVLCLSSCCMCTNVTCNSVHPPQLRVLCLSSCCMSTNVTCNSVHPPQLRVRCLSSCCMSTNVTCTSVHPPQLWSSFVLYTITLRNFVVPTRSVWLVILFRETGVVHRIT